MPATRLRHLTSQRIEDLKYAAAEASSLTENSLTRDEKRITIPGFSSQ